VSSCGPNIINSFTSNNGGGCATPKAKRFRISERLSCPPTPMKKRVTSSNFSSKRSPVTFFSSPDIEIFFIRRRRNHFQYLNYQIGLGPLSFHKLKEGKEKASNILLLCG
ncbi:hypothetical protein CUMW_212710, partial [Citrus unshiu]